MPTHPLTVPTDAELSLIQAARYETDLNSRGHLPRRVFSVQALISVAALILGYDVTSVFLFR